jgi:hypothetical protein
MCFPDFDEPETSKNQQPADDAAARAAALEAERKRERNRQGRESTILTGRLRKSKDDETKTKLGE